MHQIGIIPKKRRKKNLQKSLKTTEEEVTEAIEVIETMTKKKTMDLEEIEGEEETEILTAMDFLPETMITEDSIETGEEAVSEVVADSTEVIVNKEVVLTETIANKEVALTEEIVKKEGLTEAIAKREALTEEIANRVALTEATGNREASTETAMTKIGHLQGDKAALSIETLKITIKILEGVQISTKTINRAIPTTQLLRLSLQSTKPTWSSSQRDSNHGQK